MHRDASTRKTVAAPSGAGPLAFAALLGANVALAFAPWLVRLADTGPVAAGFWRIALCSRVLGQGLMIYALGRFSPLLVGVALLVQPVVAGTIGWIAYSERLGAADFVGAALIAAALVLVRGSMGMTRAARGRKGGV